MNPLEQVSGYLTRLEQRLRWSVLSRGAAWIAGSALLATVVLVMVINSYAFSDRSLGVARFFLFLSVALAATFGLIGPLLRLNRRFAAWQAEKAVPDFKERLLTFAEKHQGRDPFLELLASDTMDVADRAAPDTVVKNKVIFGGMSVATMAILTLAWLIVSGPGFWGHGASLLWAGMPKNGNGVAFYDITVTPGTKSVRRKADQVITAQLLGFQSTKAVLFAKYKSASKWEQTGMMPQASGNGFEFLFAGLPETVDYYVESGGVKSKTYTLNAVDLPGVKKIKVTYHYPNWAGMKEVSDESSADLRAVEGSTADVDVLTDQPLKAGVLILDDGTRVTLEKKDGNWLTARLPINKDGMYHVAAIENKEDIRLTEDYFIEAKKETPPTVKLVRPGRDAKVNPIEEVTLAVEAEDDFALSDVSVHYSVNGGAEKTVSVMKQKGVKQANGQTVLTLEDFKLQPGDIVSVYATAKDALSTSKTDIAFIEAQPFEREYSQSQQAGGGGGGGDQDQDERGISARQREIIVATFNQVRDRSKDKAKAAENAKFLSDVQEKLQAQSKSLAERMRKRQLSGAGQEFQAFSKNMDQAAAEMGTAVGKLRGGSWNDALTPEQKALQFLLRAESIFRQIQVAFGQQGGGGGGGGASRDLENLFDLELDTEKNQYETGQQQASADQRAKEVDEALRKLEELARRQQELAQQQNQKNQMSQQRWQQEMLRREAEELKRQMEQLARHQKQQQGQQQSSSQQSSSSQSSSSSSSSSQQGSSGQQQSSQQQQQLQRAIERLTRATDDMRRAGQQQQQQQQQGQEGQQGQQQGQQGQQQGQQSASASAADARRAADRLQEARDMLNGLRQQESGSKVDDLARRAQQLSAQQHQFEDKLKQAYGGQQGQQQRLGQSGAQAEQLAQEKERIGEGTSALERDIQRAIQGMGPSQRKVQSKLREGLGEMQQMEIPLRNKFNADGIRRGYGSYLLPRENVITNSLDKLKDQMNQAQAMMGGEKGDGKGNEGTEKALERLEKARQQLEAMSRNGQQQGQRGQQQGGQQQGGQQQGQNGQQGQQQGQNGQQQGGQQPGQQQAQNGQQGGQQQGGQQQGGQQQGGMQQGGAQGGPNGGYRQYGGNMGNGLDRPYQSPADFERTYRETMRDLAQIQQMLRDNPDMAKDLGGDFQQLMRDMQRFDPKAFLGNPGLLEAMRAQILPNLQNLELQLRRKLDEKNGNGDVRSGATERIPQGYSEAVADYFRRLSKGKTN